MTTKELIAKLQEFDPVGDFQVVIDNNDLDGDYLDISKVWKDYLYIIINTI